MTAATAENPTDAHADAQGPHWRVAGMKARLQAALLDGVISVLIGFFLGLILLGVGVGPDRHGGIDHMLPALGVGMWIGATLYLGLSESRRGPLNGQTVGKRSEDIRTVRARGGLPIGPGRAWIRAALLALLLPQAFPLRALAYATYAPSDDASRSLFWAGTSILVAIGAMQRSRRTPVDWLCGTAVVEDSIVTPLPAANDPSAWTSADPATRPEIPQAGVGQPLRPLPVLGQPRHLGGLAIATFTAVLLTADAAGLFAG